MEERYNVYFAGQLLEGQELAGVRDNLAKLFNADQQTLDRLFSGKAQLLKSDCDKSTALKYKQAMERAGARPIIKASQESVAQTPPPAEPPPAMTAAERIAALAAAPDQEDYRSDSAQPTSQSTNQAVEDTGDIVLAPPGTEVLREDERPEHVTREVDTTALDIDETSQRLSEEPPAPPPAPDTSHLEMGAVGDTIPTLPSDQQALSPDTDAIALSAQGTDFTDCAPPAAEAPELDLSGLDVAPVGADVLDDEYRNREQAQAPSTDHISLED